MFKRIDGDTDEVITGFCWENRDGDIEHVQMEHIGIPLVEIEDSVSSTVRIYIEDIPKLIKALQAAYDFKGN